MVYDRGMNHSHVLVIAALIASLLLVFQLKQRLVAGVAAVAAALEALFAFHIIHFGVHGINLGLVLAAVIAVCGGLLWLKTSGKTHTTAATVLTLVGLIQVSQTVL
jgi:hypothetical protein